MDPKSPQTPPGAESPDVESQSSSTPDTAASSARPADAPDAPDSPDTIDPELARLPPTRRRRSPVIAFAVLALGGLLLAHLRHDLAYSLSSSEALEVEVPRMNANLAGLPTNRLATVRGMPDYRNALLFEPKGDNYRRAFFRLLGADTRLLVRAEQTSTRHEIDQRFTGRLRRFDDIPYAAQIRDYYASLEVTRFLDLKALREKLAQPGSPAGELALVDGAGDPLGVARSRPLRWVVDFPGDLKVSLPHDQFAVEEDARHELERLGAPVAGAPVENKETWTYVVKVPADRRDAYMHALDDKGFGFALHRERLDVPAAEARIDGEQVILKGTPYAWSQIASVQVEAPIHIPADALLLLEGETPREHLWAQIVAALLVVFMGFNLWLLVRSLRAPRAAPPPAA